MGTSNVTRFENVNDIREHYRRNNPSEHWVEDSNVRFYGSRLSDAVYTTPCDGSTVYFVSSEHNASADNSTLAYSVRAYDVATASVSAVGTFQGYTTVEQATHAAGFISGDRSRAVR